MRSVTGAARRRKMKSKDVAGDERKNGRRRDMKDAGKQKIDKLFLFWGGLQLRKAHIRWSRGAENRPLKVER